jgi:hypothetical protein
MRLAPKANTPPEMRGAVFYLLICQSDGCSFNCVLFSLKLKLEETKIDHLA